MKLKITLPSLVRAPSSTRRSRSTRRARRGPTRWRRAEVPQALTHYFEKNIIVSTASSRWRVGAPGTVVIPGLRASGGLSTHRHPFSDSRDSNDSSLHQHSQSHVAPGLSTARLRAEASRGGPSMKTRSKKAAGPRAALVASLCTSMLLLLWLQGGRLGGEVSR